MKKYVLPFLLISLLFVCGCSSSSSDGDSPSADYSGNYNITRLYEDIIGVMTIVQNGSHAAVTYRAYTYDLTQTISDNESTKTVTIESMLGQTGTGNVHGRHIDVTWGTGNFTRLSFSSDGLSFSASGDIGFSGSRTYTNNF